MAELSLCCNSLTPRALPPPVQHPRSSPRIPTGGLEQRRGTRAAFAAKPGGFSLKSISKSCQTCRGKGAIECPGCKGTGKNKKNGNIFERWKSLKTLNLASYSWPPQLSRPAKPSMLIRRDESVQCAQHSNTIQIQETCELYSRERCRIAAPSLQQQIFRPD